MSTKRTENLIVIVGAGCNGKTPIAVYLREKYFLYTIHTDSFYLPLDGKKPSSVLGVIDPVKTNYIKYHKKRLTGISVLEGSHAANSKELDIWVKHLGIDGWVLVLEAKSPQFSEWVKEKWGVSGGFDWEKYILDIYYDMADIEPDGVITCKEDIYKFFKEKNGILHISRPYKH